MFRQVDKSLSALVLLCVAGLLLSACSQNPARVKHYGDHYYGLASGKTPGSGYTSIKRDKSSYKTIKVQRGDSLYAIAKRFDVSAKEIVQLNRLKAPYHLKIGQKLKLGKPRFYTVKRGDTLYEVSRDLGVDMARLGKINGLKRPYTIQVGQRLRVPSSSYKVASVSKGKRKDWSKKSSRKVASKKKSKSTSKKKNYASKKSSKRRVASSKPPGKFIWPVKGKVISNFGPKKGGVYNDGINIAVREGAAVKAAASGEVVYVGNELKGYGNLVIIKHKKGWLTAYAHNKEVLVKKGSKVKQGQRIARAGASGKVKSTQLHFGLRKGREAVDPIRFLSG